MRPSLLDQFVGDRQQYVAMGFIILATTTEAMISGGFAVSRAFSDADGAPIVPWWGIIAFALVWGAIIFAIDRFMVLGLEGIHGLRALVMIVFRGGLALLLGFVMATPLVIAVLSADLSAEVKHVQGEQLQGLVAQQTAAKEKWDELQLKADDAKVALDEAQAARTPNPLGDPDYQAARARADESLRQATAAAEKAAREFNGVLPKSQGGSGRGGYGPQYVAYKKAADDLRRIADADEAAAKQAFQDADVVPDNIDAVITQRTEDWTNSTTAAKNAYDIYQHYVQNTASAQQSQSPGLLTSMTALDHLINGRPATADEPAQPANANAALTHGFLVGLLIALELTPVLFKGVKQALHGWGENKGYLTPYEQACREQDEQARTRMLQWETDATQAWSSESSLQATNADDMAARQAELQAEMNEEVVLTQRVLMRRALRAWRREQTSRWGDQDAAEFEAELDGEREFEAAARRVRTQEVRTTPDDGQQGPGPVRGPVDADVEGD